MRALAKWFGLGVLGFLLVLSAAGWLTAKPSDPVLWPPRAGAAVAEIYVVSHGYHSGIVVRRAATEELAGRKGDTALLAMTRRFPSYQWIEIGWGDEGFYRSVPDVASLSFTLAVRALFLPGNRSVVHVVGLNIHPRDAFPRSEMVHINLTAEGFSRMLDRLDASIARTGEGGGPEDLGVGLYGPSKFFRSVETFSIFNVCNHWVARLLAAAGLPSAPVLATLPQGLLLDLKWRAGLRPLPQPAVQSSFQSNSGVYRS
jgi:uncharacterized protein (TIGR02117 family)